MSESLEILRFIESVLSGAAGGVAGELVKRLSSIFGDRMEEVKSAVSNKERGKLEKLINSLGEEQRRELEILVANGNNNVVVKGDNNITILVPASDKKKQ